MLLVLVEELELLVQYRICALLYQSRQMSVERYDVVVEVVQACTVRHIDAFGSLDGVLEVSDVLAVAVG